MKKALKLSLLLLVVLSLSSCDWPWEDDEDEVETTAGSSVAASSGGTNVGITTTAAAPAATSTTAAATPAETTSSGITENGRYVGRTNGNRPTWYFGKTMRRYPSSFKFSVSGCASFTVKNNGHRWEGGGYIVKQSDVSGRGMAALAPASCGSRTARVSY